MKFVINDILYDTEKMERVAVVSKWRQTDNFMTRTLYPGVAVGSATPHELWRSGKNRWLLTRDMDYDKCGGEAITEDEAKNLLKRYDYKKFVELYGELEEA